MGGRRTGAVASQLALGGHRCRASHSEAPPGGRRQREDGPYPASEPQASSAVEQTAPQRAFGAERYPGPHQAELCRAHRAVPPLVSPETGSISYHNSRNPIYVTNSMICRVSQVWTVCRPYSKKTPRYGQAQISLSCSPGWKLRYLRGSLDAGISEPVLVVCATGRKL